MELFRKNKRNQKKNEAESAMEGLREFGIADCFFTIPFGRNGKKCTEEEIKKERERTIEKCKGILREYEERIQNEGQCDKRNQNKREFQMRQARIRTESKNKNGKQE